MAEANDNAELREQRETSDFLAATDASGRIVDFHSLRHTYITRLVQSGASVKVAQELARHSTPTLTLGRYAHLGLHDTSAALNNLPSLTPPTPVPQAQQFRKTGTDDLPYQ
ncbi:MAG: tyrosine-type recombinase/integrase [Phycisphaerales bacterium]|nr:tyrosine-type recombinase/integrase [Phycisphaerales bacterium]